MKKILSFLLALAMLLGALALSACGDPIEITDNDDDGENTDGGNNDGDNNSNNSNNGNKNKIDMTKITDMVPYREGLAFAEINDDISKSYCIDKEGKILFTLDIKVGLENLGFYNGIAIFGGSAESVWICDKEGKITKPEDLGGDTILIEPSLQSHASNEFFRSGYFFVKKTTTTFSGSKDEAAIYNHKLEKLHDFSEELYRIYEEFLVSACYGGYLYEYNGYDEPTVFDPISGKKVTDFSKFLEDLKLKNPSDMWYWEGDGVYDMLGSSETPVIDMSKYSETLYYIDDFKDGMAGVTFESADKFFFTIMKEDGSFCFEPVELSGSSPNVKYSNGKFMVTTSKIYDYIFETFDAKGKIASLTVDTEGKFMGFDFSDDVAIVNHIMKDDVKIYKTDFTLLF
ncbi:MAG: hypothetical protein IJZ03_08455 [Clostridia bacterium]|nr:hypothetical protein [Clostridia bacterium]